MALGKTLAEIDRLPIREFNKWWAYHQHRPFGDMRQDLRFAMLAQLIHNMLVKTPKGIMEFLLFDGDVGAQQQTPAQQRRILDAMIGRSRDSGKDDLQP